MKSFANPKTSAKQLCKWRQSYEYSSKYARVNTNVLLYVYKVSSAEIIYGLRNLFDAKLLLIILGDICARTDPLRDILLSVGTRLYLESS